MKKLFLAITFVGFMPIVQAESQFKTFGRYASQFALVLGVQYACSGVTDYFSDLGGAQHPSAGLAVSLFLGNITNDIYRKRHNGRGIHHHIHIARNK